MHIITIKYTFFLPTLMVYAMFVSETYLCC